MNRKTFFLILFGFFLNLKKKFSSILEKENHKKEDSLKPNKNLLG
jgi:hypothetical protein